MMITWEQFKKGDTGDEDRPNYQITDIICPQCGEPLYMYTGIVLTTYPAQYRYECLKCGWSGTGYIRYTPR